MLILIACTPTLAINLRVMLSTSLTWAPVFVPKNLFQRTWASVFVIGFGHQRFFNTCGQIWFISDSTRICYCCLLGLILSWNCYCCLLLSWNCCFLNTRRVIKSDLVIFRIFRIDICSRKTKFVVTLFQIILEKTSCVIFSFFILFLML